MEIWYGVQNNIVFLLTDKNASSQGRSELQVKPNQIANRTLNFEAGNDEDQATMKESFSLVQNILFIEYTDIFPHV